MWGGGTGRGVSGGSGKSRVQGVWGECVGAVGEGLLMDEICSLLGRVLVGNTLPSSLGKGRGLRGGVLEEGDHLAPNHCITRNRLVSWDSTWNMTAPWQNTFARLAVGWTGFNPLKVVAPLSVLQKPNQQPLLLPYFTTQSFHLSTYTLRRCMPRYPALYTVIS